MPNKRDLLKRLADLTEIEKQLWNSFRTAEVKSSIGTFALVKQIRVRKGLPNQTHWFAKNHPCFMMVALIAAVITPMLESTWKSVGFVLYSAFLLFALLSRDKFMAAYAKNELRTTNVTEHAFGIDNLSLHVFNLLNADNLPMLGSLQKEDIASLIKIVKSSQEYLNTRYGYYDHARKVVVAGIVTLPISTSLVAYQYWKAIPGYVDTTMQFVEKYNLLSPVPLMLMLLLAAAIAVLLYSLAFGDQRLERQKKRYLLMLNIVHETWQ